MPFHVILAGESLTTFRTNVRLQSAVRSRTVSIQVIFSRKPAKAELADEALAAGYDSLDFFFDGRTIRLRDVSFPHVNEQALLVMETLAAQVAWNVDGSVHFQMRCQFVLTLEG